MSKVWSVVQPDTLTPTALVDFGYVAPGGHADGLGFWVKVDGDESVDFTLLALALPGSLGGEWFTATVSHVTQYGAQNPVGTLELGGTLAAPGIPPGDYLYVYFSADPPADAPLSTQGQPLLIEIRGA